MRITVRAEFRNALGMGQRMRDELIQKLDEDVERTTLEAVNESRRLAPILTSALVNSIMPIPAEAEPMKRAYGSSVPYARRQEYEHKSKAGFFRKAVWKARGDLRDRVERTIRQLGG